MTVQSETASCSSVFVVTAYRWGTLNNHSYNVFASTDREQAIERAREECQGRGGKYGIDVIEYPSEQRVAYFPSNAEDKTASGPTEAPEIYAAERVGRRVLLAYKQLTQTASEGEQMFLRLVKAPHELPSWLVELCKQELEMFGPATPAS